MPVRCVPQEQKAYIAHLWLNEKKRITNIAEMYAVSRRTIGRVLVEQGIEHARVKKAMRVERQLELELETQQQPAPVIPESTLTEKAVDMFKRLLDKLLKPFKPFNANQQP